jgi:O-antigen/teichoic acid export membrane protein
MNVLKRFLTAGSLKLVFATMQIAFTLIIAKLYPANESASFFWYFSIIMIVSSLCRGGFDLGVLRLYSRIPRIGGRILTTALISCSVLSIIAIVILYLISFLLGKSSSYMFFCIPVISAAHVISFYCQYKKNYLMQQLMQNGPYLYAIILLLYGSDIWTLEQVFIGSWLFNVVLFVLYFHRQLDVIKINRTLFIRLFKYSQGLWLVGLASTLMGWLPIFLSGLLIHSQNDIEALSVALRVGVAVSFALNISNNVFGRDFALMHKDSDFYGIKRLYFKVMLLGAISSIFALLLFYFISPLFLSYIDVDYSYINLFYVIIFSQILNAIFGPVGLVLNMGGKQDVVFKGTFLAVLSICILAYSFSLKYEVLGIGYCVFIMVFISNMYCFPKIITFFNDIKSRKNIETII